MNKSMESDVGYFEINAVFNGGASETVAEVYVNWTEKKL